MDTIIHEIMSKIIQNNNKNMEELFVEHKDISRYILDTKEMLDQIGTMLVARTLEMTDEVVKKSPSRKKSWYVQRKNDKKTLMTVFGDVNYSRTYYKHKKDGHYSYLSDDALGIEVHDRMDISLKANSVEKSLDLSYQKSGENIAGGSSVSDQTVMNCIREIGAIENCSVEIKDPKRAVDIIYVEADEDHVAMQDGSNKEVKLVYVHEGRKQVGTNRYELINTRYFTSACSNPEDLWLEVADYMYEAYDMDKAKKIYLSGDGARWIKEGLNWIKGSQYVLDYFHLSKYIKKATGHMPYIESALWNYINKLDKKNVKDLFKIIIDGTERETKRASVKESLRYILNNWEGIEKRYEEEYIGCSAEGHVSHILSARLSSRPLGWSLLGADQMARLRVYRANGGNIYEIIAKRKEESRKEKQIVKLDMRIVKNRLRKQALEQLDNITILNTGKRTCMSEFLKSIRGA